MNIAAIEVKALREKTGAGMMDCKKALIEAQGDAEKAEIYLKELGLAAADKREDRDTNAGRVFSRIVPLRGGKRGILLELSCETDFVAINKDFIALGESLVDSILIDNVNNKELLNSKIKDTMSRIKENMNLRRYRVLQADSDEELVEYNHGNGNIGVLVKFGLSDVTFKEDAKFKATAFDFALHIAAFGPRYFTRDQVEDEYLKEMEHFYRKQTENDEKNSNKPQQVIESIVKGKLNKHLAGICLMEQGFVREEKVKCAKVLENLSKELGGTVRVTDFLYFKAGAGMA